MSVNYAIFRIKKLKSRDRSEANKKAIKGAKSKSESVKGALNHLFREINTPNADAERTSENVVLKGADNVKDIMKDFDSRMPKKIRANAVKAVEVVITGSSQRMNEMSKEEQMDYFKQSLAFVGRKFGGEENILSAVVHNDETTPHLSVMLVPLVDGKLNVAKFTDGISKMKDLQTAFASEVGKKFGLERGIERERPRDHIELQKYYKVTNQIFEQLRTRPDDLKALGELVKQIDYQNDVGDIVEKLSKVGKESQAKIAERISKEIDEMLGEEKGLMFENKITVKEAKKIIPEAIKKILTQDLEVYHNEEVAKLSQIDEFEKKSVERIDEKRNALKSERERLESERKAFEEEREKTREQLKKEVLEEQNGKFNRLLNFWRKNDGTKPKDVDEFNNLINNTIEGYKNRIKGYEDSLEREKKNNVHLLAENRKIEAELNKVRNELDTLKNDIKNPEFLKGKLDEIKRSEEQKNKIVEATQRSKTSFKMG
ncbi:MobV family relaxase [Actinobacillus genomosp. 1]|uniref:MobV family relaxase n=1 Tax=Actinobacillus genomosp. 1 TaxID=254839 RepID=UPI0024422F01|nr:MobV family relaxase [Actinobacillus genomosp. 1]WGE90262.1 plasmid recombination protein [Actinobacillus genomosp. 1]